MKWDKLGIKSNKIAYTCYFETQLEIKDFGKHRREHYYICNQRLLNQIEGLQIDGIDILNEVSNEILIKNIHKNPYTSPHGSLVWEHCSTSKVNDGRAGVMRLVPESEHNSKSEFWRTIHPDYKNRGGYHEWAIPNGAPVNNRSNKHLPGLKTRRICQLTPEELPAYFHKAVVQNKFDVFQLVLKRAQYLGLTNEAIGAILTQRFTDRDYKRPTTLLHIAAENGHLLFINKLLTHFSSLPNYLHSQNYKGNTPAHCAASHNRSKTLKKLIILGADLSFTNNRNQSVSDIITKRKFKACLSLIESVKHSELITKGSQNEGNSSHCTKEKQESQSAVRMTYKDRINKGKPQKTASQCAKEEKKEKLYAPHPSVKKTYGELLSNKSNIQKPEGNNSHSTKEKQKPQDVSQNMVRMTYRERI